VIKQYSMENWIDKDNEVANSIAAEVLAMFD
jgi:hypothetical protein